MSNRKQSSTFWILVALTVASLLFSPPQPTFGEANPEVLLHLRYATFDPLQGEPLPTHGLLSTAEPRADGTAYRLVQFSGPIAPHQRAALRATGAQIVAYVPDFAYLVRTNAAARQRIADLEGLRWTGPYRPAYKLHPALQTPASTDGADYPLLVQLFPGEEAGPAIERAQAYGAAGIQAHLSERGALLRIERGGLQALPHLLRLEAVRWAEPAPKRQIFNDVGGELMGVPTVWEDTGLYGSDQIVAVTDSGLDTGTTGPGINDDFEGRIVAGYSLCGDSNSWDDPNGHGTHVAGSVLGNGTNSGSNPTAHDYAGSFAGTAPEARLIFQAALDQNGEMSCIPDDLYPMFTQSYNAGARVHTNSWGTANTDGDYTLDAQAVDQFLWDHPDMTILFAVGNDGVDADHDGVVEPLSVKSPSTAKNVIAVGASEGQRASGGLAWTSYGEAWPSSYPAQPIKGDYTSDNPAGVVPFSSRGPTDDGRIRPDLVAPGTNIISVHSAEADPKNSSGVYDADYVYMCGTSMATPLTAGAAALARQWLAAEQGLTRPSGALVKALLINGATDLTPGQYGSGAYQQVTSLPDNNQGWGRVNLRDSLTPQGQRVVWVEEHTSGLQTGDEVVYSVAVTAAGQSAAGLSPSLHLTTPAAPAAEALTNGDFETGAFTPWETYNQTVLVTTPTHGGSYAAKLGGHGYIDGQGDQLFQAVNVPDDASSITLRLWYDLDSTQIIAGIDLFTVGIWDQSGNTKLVSVAQVDGTNPTSGWVSIEYNFTASDLAQVRGQTILVGLIVTNNNFNYTTAYVDDVSLDIERGAVPPPTEGAIVFVRGGELWFMDTDGSNAQRWHQGLSGGADFPRWSPDGSRLTHVDAGNTLLMIQGLDGDRHQVDKTAGVEAFFYSTAWSPDGSRLLFSAGGWAGTGLYILNADGTGSALDLTPTWGGESPDWSPSGTRIVYKGYQGHLWLVDPDGTDKQELFNQVAWDPRWSPDGSQIGFIYVNAAAQSCFATITSQGTNLTDRLCSGSANLWEPAWSPDGKSIVLEVSTVSGTDLWRYDLDSDTTKQLTTDGNSTKPDWRWQDPPPAQEPPGVAGSLRLTLVWTDAPGAPANAVQLVNDLDLKVVGPAGTSYYPNGAAQADRLNPTEDVFIASPQTGTYQVTVRGYNVPQGPQPYALVISGEGLTVRLESDSSRRAFLPLIRK